MNDASKSRYTSQWAIRLWVGRHRDKRRIYELVNMEDRRAYESVDIEMSDASMIH